MSREILNIEPEQVGNHPGVEYEINMLRMHLVRQFKILTVECGWTDKDAILESVRSTSTLARNNGHYWSSLDIAMGGLVELREQLKCKIGVVDSLPFGVASIAILPGGKVVPQGRYFDPSVIDTMVSLP